MSILHSTFKIPLLMLLAFWGTLLKGDPLSPRETPQSSVSFIENLGQVSDQYHNPRPDVLYSGTDGQFVYHIRNQGISYQLRRMDEGKFSLDQKDQYSTESSENRKIDIHRIDLNWLGTNPHPGTLGEFPLPGQSNYYLSSCENGILGVKTYTKVVLQEVYPGINIQYSNQERSLKCDFLVAPFADYHQIRIEVKGAESSLLPDGSLLLKTPLGTIREGAPVVFQDGEQLPSNWVLKGNILSFDVPDYDPSKELIIDPDTRLWGTYYGGNGLEDAHSTRADANGNVFLAGEAEGAFSTVIATSGAHQTSVGGNKDAYLVKFNPQGQRLWGTYYGGSGDDFGYACAVATSGDVYLSGRTQSGNAIASSGSYQTSGNTLNGSSFLVKFTSAGVRDWGTYYGGTSANRSFGCATDANGNVFISGLVTSGSPASDFATSGAHQGFRGGDDDCFVAKFSSTGMRLWGTYYGGNEDEFNGKCATDASGNIYLAGGTESRNGIFIASSGSHQPSIGGAVNRNDGFLVKFDPNGVRLWGTYYGGTANETVTDVATDPMDNVFISGTSNSGSGITSANGNQTSSNGSGDAYLAKFNSSGVRQWGTYHGGSAVELGNACTADSDGNSYLAGYTSSTSNIATPGAFKTSLTGGSSDAMLIKYAPDGTLLKATYYGRNLPEQGKTCTTDPMGNVYLGGLALGGTGSSVGTSNGHQPNFGGGIDGFLVKFEECVSATVTQNISACGSQVSPSGTQTWTASGTYVDTLQRVNGCDSFIVVNLTILNATSETINPVACNSFLSPAGNTYTSSANFTEIIQNVAGCDSTITVNLTVNNSSTSTIAPTACNIYQSPAGNTYTTSGIYTETIQNAEGCDSTITINLIVNNSSTATISPTACNSYLSPAGSTYTTSGTYTETIPNAEGCDSTITINLTVNNSSTATIAPTVCNTYLSPAGNTYTTTGTYTETLQNAVGCDSTITINLTVNNSSTATIAPTVCTSYQSPAGNIYTTSGTYTETIQNAEGCDSTITINLTVNTNSTASISPIACDSYISPAGNTYSTSGAFTETIQNAAGCDSTITINLTVNNSSAATIFESACNSYLSPAGNTYSTSGVYTETIQNAAGCDSTITINLIVNNSSAITLTPFACNSYLSPAGNTYTTSGTYTETLQNAVGCDSVITINLTVGNNSTATISPNACTSYISPAGNTYTTSGTYTETIQNASGCDSTITINLTVNTGNTTSISPVACDTYVSGAGNMYSTSGTFTENLQNVAGCDSIVTINLTINNSSSTTISPTSCVNYTSPGGSTYTSSGVYTETLQNSVGCDSVITINLTILENNDTILTPVVCDSYLSPAGNTYTTSGTYTDFLPNAAGCDSIILIQLTVNNSSATTIAPVACNSYLSPAGNTYTVSGTYTETLFNAAGCDSTITINLTVNNVDPTIALNGTVLSANMPGALYQWIYCDQGFAPIAGATNQTYTPIINGLYACIVTANSCSDTSQCIPVIVTSVPDPQHAVQISAYPNPTEGPFEIHLGQTLDQVEVNVWNVTGQLVEREQVEQTDRIHLFLAKPAGAYIVEIWSEGSMIDRIKVIKL